MSNKVTIDIGLEEQRLKEFEKLNELLDKAEKNSKELKNATIAVQRAREKGGNASIAQQNRLQRALIKDRDLTRQIGVSQKRLNVIRKESTLEVKKETLAVKKLNTERKKSAGIIGKLTSSMAKWGGTILAAIALLKRLGKIKDTLVTLDAFRFAMTKITNSAKEAADAWAFVTTMSDKYGVSLAKTADRYVKFSTAAKQAGLSLTNTQSIYNSLSKASGVLGLKTHEVEGVFLALEQMLSKGKITTEELRRQLGERLPGAFGMMVTAYNRLHPEQQVTLQQFDELLKKGRVLSHEVLPEFARVVEEQLGIKTVNEVNTLQAAIVRADNAFVTMVEDMEKGTGKLAKITIAFYKILKEAYTEIGELFLTIGEQEEKYFARGFSQRKIFLKEQRDKRPIGDAAGMFPDEESRDEAIRKYLADTYITYSKELERLKEKLANYSQGKEIFQEIMSLGTRVTDKDDLEMRIQDLSERVGKFKGALLELKEIDLSNLNVGAGDEGTKDKPKWVPEIDPESIDGLKQSIKFLKELKDSLNPSEWGAINQEIAELEQALKFLTDPDSFFSDDIGIDAKTRAEAYIEPLKDYAAAVRTFARDADVDLSKLDIPAILKEYFEQGGTESITALRKFFGKWLNELEKAKEKSKEELDQMKKQFQQELTQAIGDFMVEIINIGNAMLDARLEAINAEIQAEEDKYDRLMELAEGDDARQKELERNKKARMKELQAEELKIRQKQAKFNKAQAITDIITSTAVAIMGVWQSYAPLGPWGAAAAAILTALVAATGVAQLAAVAKAPIPKYASGRIGGSEGLAIVGDGGQQEVIKKKDGTAYMTPSKATLTWLDKGDDVYSSVDAYRHAIQRDIFNSYRTNETGIVDAIEKGFSKALIKQSIRPVVNVKVDAPEWRRRNTQF